MLPAPPPPKRAREQETKEIGSIFKQKKRIVKLTGDNGITEAFKLGGEVEIKLEEKDEMEELLKNFGEDQFKDNELDKPVAWFRSLMKQAIKAWYEQICLQHSKNSNLREQILVVMETTSSCPKTCASYHKAFHMLEKINDQLLSLLETGVLSVNNDRLAPVIEELKLGELADL